MRRAKRGGSLILSLLINIILNAELSLPAWLLLILHFAIGFPIMWFWIALAAWIVIVVVWSLLFGAVINTDTESIYTKPEVKIVLKKDDNAFEKKETEKDLWVCTCGEKNSGKFCSECGSPKPDITE